MIINDRCFFLRDKSSNEYIGTCCAWFSHQNNVVVPVLHWLAVKPKYRNKGYARILITETMKCFMDYYYNQAIYLHTQPSSYQAIKLYYDFGFRITVKDCYGSAQNDYNEAMKILKVVMDEDNFNKIKNSVVL